MSRRVRRLGGAHDRALAVLSCRCPPRWLRSSATPDSDIPRTGCSPIRAYHPQRRRARAPRARPPWLRLARHRSLGPSLLDSHGRPPRPRSERCPARSRRNTASLGSGRRRSSYSPRLGRRLERRSLAHSPTERSDSVWLELPRVGHAAAWPPLPSRDWQVCVSSLNPHAGCYLQDGTPASSITIPAAISSRCRRLDRFAQPGLRRTRQDGFGPHSQG